MQYSIVYNDSINGTMDNGASVNLELTEELRAAIATITAAVDAQQDPAITAAQKAAEDAKQTAAAAEAEAKEAREQLASIEAWINQVFGDVKPWKEGEAVKKGEYRRYRGLILEALKDIKGEAANVPPTESDAWKRAQDLSLLVQGEGGEVVETWDPSKTYTKGAVVVWGPNRYRAKKESTGNEPDGNPASPYWELIGPVEG